MSQCWYHHHPTDCGVPPPPVTHLDPSVGPCRRQRRQQRSSSQSVKIMEQQEAEVIRHSESDPPGGRAELETLGDMDSVTGAESPRIPAADDSDTDEGLGGLGKSKTKSRTAAAKTRRARRKAFRPYYQLSEGERGAREEREQQRLRRLRERMWARGRIIAPYNTTQFLMAQQPEEECYYVSNEQDDQDFMSNEFKKEYEVHNLNRLERMSKEMLLNEYMILERKNEHLEEKLKTIQSAEEVQEKAVIGQTNLEQEYANRVHKLHAEMEKLKMENQRLLTENVAMRKRLNNESETEESSDAESSSGTSSSSEEVLATLSDNKETTYRETQTSDDLGYESNQSKGEIK